MYSCLPMRYTKPMNSYFLENKNHSYRIAQVAVIYQSIITFLITYCLIIAITTRSLLVEELFWLVTADSIFVVLHLTYRALYRGQKVVLSSVEKKLLGIHAITSMCALAVTGYFVLVALIVNTSLMSIVLIIWVISLVSGIAFYKRKYGK